MQGTHNVGVREVVEGIKDCMVPCRTDPSSYRLNDIQFLDTVSGVHCLLTAMNFPIDSEILITGFATPNMQRVLKLHGLRIIAVDLNIETMEPVVALLSVITPNTRMLIVNHVFGATISVPITEAIPNLLILENLSTTYQYKGGDLCDIKMYDVPLGGGLFHFKDSTLRDRVKRVQRTYKTQWTFGYLRLLTNWCIYAMIHRVCAFLSRGKIRRFRPKMSNFRLIPSAAMGIKQFISGLEVRPCIPCISMLYKVKAIKSRNCYSNLSALFALSDAVNVPGRSVDFHSFCSQSVYPVTVRRPQKVISKMREFGYSVSDATSYPMEAIAAATNCVDMMENVLFIPLNLSPASFSKMTDDLKKIVSGDRSRPKQNRLQWTWNVIRNILCSIVCLYITSYIWKYLICFVFIIVAICYFSKTTECIKDDIPYRGTKGERIVSDSPINVMVSGSTGFLGECLVRDLLDSYPRDRLKLYLIIRHKKNKTSRERAEAVFGDLESQNITVIDGDLNTLDIDTVCAGIDDPITHVIHSAANVSFGEKHSLMAKSNIMGSMTMKVLSERLNAKLIYISTAFVTSKLSSDENDLSDRNVIIPGNEYTAKELCDLMLANSHLIDEYMAKHSIPNNYVLTKIITENLLGSNCIIVRPSIISVAWNFPKPGWSGNTPSTVGLIFAGALSRLMRCIYPRPGVSYRQLVPMPVIPVDFVSKCIMDKMLKPIRSSQLDNIYLAALSSARNPLPPMKHLKHFFGPWAYSMELLTCFEIVLIWDIVTWLSGIFGSSMYGMLCYILNELPAPRRWKGLLRVARDYEFFMVTRFKIANGMDVPSKEFNQHKYLWMVLEAAAESAKKPIWDLANNVPLRYTENLLISITNTMVSILLKRTTNSVVVNGLDRLKTLSNKKNILFVPTHRSFYDFLLICKMCCKYSMFGLSMPSSFASSKFQSMPLIAWLMRRMKALFINTNGGNMNGTLRRQIEELNSNVFQLFIEGTRSRDRSFLKPRTGVISTLNEIMPLTIVPVAINYEKVPEELSFHQELDKEKVSMSMSALFHWLYRVFWLNDVNLGDIRIEIGEIFEIEQRAYDQQHADELVQRIQDQHKKMVTVTKYHVQYYEKKMAQRRNVNGAAHEWTVEALLEHQGCRVLPTALKTAAKTEKEVYCSTMQFQHFLKDFLEYDAFEDFTRDQREEEKAEREDVAAREEALCELVANIRQIMGKFNRESGSIFTEQYSSRKLPAMMKTEKINVGEENLGYWGYSDCGFTIKDGKLSFRGSRYEIGNKSFDSIAFLSKLSGIPLLRNRQSHSVNYNKSIRTLPADHDVLQFLEKLFGDQYEHCVSTDIDIRYHHGTGHTISDMMSLRIEDNDFRVPEVVIWPTSREQIVAVVEQCGALKCALIPYGGGTNVTHSLWCDPDEQRVIISVDMRKMNRIQWVNRENNTASIEAGMTGKAMERELAKYGYTTGHCPDSYEFSTLGGWIATFASGMKRNKYGNIEDIVIDMEVVTARGVMTRNVPFGRVSNGSNNLLQFYGSEGTLGIIISAVIRLSPIPDKVDYDSAVFKCWDDGINLLKMVKNQPKYLRPASLRLVDNTQFKLSQTMKEKESSSMLSKMYLKYVKGFNFDSIVAATIVYEGNPMEIKLQREMMNKMIAANGGIHGGAKSGKAGFNLTFAIAYLRDFLLENFGILAESFETFIPWDKVDGYQQTLHREIIAEHRRRQFRGTPFLSSRISQVYNEGVCLYLYYGMWTAAIDHDAYNTYSEMEDFVKLRMIKLGGSLSHHHGVGQLRCQIQQSLSSDAMIELTRSVKRAFDPENIFCVNNALLNGKREENGKVDEDMANVDRIDASDRSDRLSSSGSNPEISSKDSSNISTPSLVDIECIH